jgi:hypothetical protein
MTNQQRANHERTHTGEKPYQVRLVLMFLFYIANSNAYLKNKIQVVLFSLTCGKDKL